MKFIKSALYITGLLFIALFLFATHSKFLFSLDPGKDTELFVFFGWNAKLVIPYIFGAAFGIVTTAIIALLEKDDEYFWHFVISVALFELIGVFLYNNIELTESIWTWFASSYYAVYSALVIIGYAYIGSARDSKLNSRQGLKLTEADISNIKQGLKSYPVTGPEKVLFPNGDTIPIDNTPQNEFKAKSFDSIEERNTFIYQQHLNGLNNVQIGNIVGRDGSTVSKIVKTMKNKK